MSVEIPNPARGHVAPLARVAAEGAPCNVFRFPATGGQRPSRLIQTRRDQAIREAAYFHWAYRGCAPGGEMEDWLAAEREVDEQLELRHAQVLQAAHARWLKRGRPHGRDLEDWLAAEQEVDASLARRGLLCGL